MLKDLGRTARWGDLARDQAGAAADSGRSDPKRGDLSSTERLHAEALSERCLMLAKAAESLSRRMGLHVAQSHERIALGGQIKDAFGVASLTMAGLGLSGLLPLSNAVLFAAIAACSVLAFATGLATSLWARRPLEGYADLAGEARAYRAAALTARRIDRGLAALDERFATANLRVVSVLLDQLDRDVAALPEAERVFSSQPIRGTRRHERIVPRIAKTTIRVKDGRVLSARIADVSLSGVAIETELPDIALGDLVMVGRREARAVRKLGRGLAFEFLKPIDSADFGVDVVL